MKKYISVQNPQSWILVLKLRWLTRAKVQRSFSRTSEIRPHHHQNTEGYSDVQRLGGWHLDHAHGPEGPICLSHP